MGCVMSGVSPSSFLSETVSDKKTWGCKFFEMMDNRSIFNGSKSSSATSSKFWPKNFFLRSDLWMDNFDGLVFCGFGKMSRLENRKKLPAYVFIENLYPSSITWSDSMTS